MTIYTRRKFVGGGATAASPLLIGTALSSGPFAPDSVAALKGASKSVVIATHEFRGDLDERLDFPASWDVQVMKMAGHDAPVLTAAEVRRRLQAPIGTPPLRQIAAGKKTAVITFDDLTRPTPTYEIVPEVLEELEAAGLAADNIVFLTSCGAHRSLESDEVERKLGKNIVRRHAWLNHNVFDNLRDAGETRFQNRVYLNRTFLAADVRVTISGVKSHTLAGFGGGAKAVLPGVAGIDTIRYNHMTLARNNKTVGTARIFQNEARLDMVEAARLAKVDFSVQLLYNGRRRVCQIFCGDIEAAHHAACRAAIRHYATPMLRNVGVVVANAYPQNAQATKALTWISRSASQDGAGVLIVQHPQMMSAWHYLYSPGYEGGRNYWEPRRRAGPPAGPLLIVYSQYLQKRQTNDFPPGTVFASAWDDVIKTLLDRHKNDASVAVYPYGCIQHEEEAALDEV